MAQSKYPYQEFSGALQQKTTTHIKKPNEVRKAKNTDFASVLGAIRRRKGAQATTESMPKMPVDAPALGAYIARFPDATEIWGVQNDAASSPTEAILRYWTGPDPDDWQTIENGLTAGAEVHMIDDLDEIWISSYDAVLDQIGTSFTVDEDHDVSTSRQLSYGPKARFFIEFAGAMWAADVVVDSTRYRDRIYKSSGPTGVITFVRSPQTDPQEDFELIDQVPVMTSNTTPAGTASASSIHSAPFPAWGAFDGTITTDGRWLALVSTGWLKYDFGAGNPKVITHYSLTPIPSNQGAENDRSPRTWTFEGSNDNSAWTTLDTQTDAPIFAGGEKRTYKITSPASYRYYRINVTANRGDTYLNITEMEMLSSPSDVNLLTLEVDSVRYLKAGRTIDVYEAGTDNLKYEINITAVDKINDTISFFPQSQSFATTDVNTSTDVITLSDASDLTTGTPIIFNSNGTVPAGLTADTTYYAINVSSTTIKVATSLLNAEIGNAVNITSTGSGNHRVRLSYVFGNKDEIWDHGRKGKLTRFWNTDYRNPEASDYIKLPASLDGQNAITAVGTISNRLFPFTSTAMFKFDGQNIINLRNDVGCIAHRSIGYYDSFMVWLDGKGKIWLRNEEGGEQDVISEAIQETMALVPQSQLPEATAVCVDDTYKLYLGQVDGKSLRVVYNFRTNQWSEEWWTPKQMVQLEYTFDGNAHPHWFDEKGQMWVDEQGTDDDGEAIHMEVEPGDDNFGADEIKKWIGVKIYSHNSVGSKIYASVDSGDWQEVGQIRKPVEAITLEKQLRGTMINFRITNSFKGDTPQIDKMTVWFNREEDTFRATQ